MTVNPGAGGQAFLPEVLPKIGRLRAMSVPLNRHPLIEVDGGISPDTAGAATAAGAEILVAGTAVFHAADYAAAIAALRSGGRDLA
jgi:ribulose-phosphate 3-epimerase